MKLKLHEMAADQILEVLEERQDKEIEAADQLNRIGAAHKRVESLVYDAHRNAGKSVEDSKRAIHTDKRVEDSLNDLFDAQVKLAYAKTAVERAKSGIDLWRSVRADRRQV